MNISEQLALEKGYKEVKTNMNYAVEKLVLDAIGSAIKYNADNMANYVVSTLSEYLSDYKWTAIFCKGEFNTWYQYDLLFRGLYDGYYILIVGNRA